MQNQPIDCDKEIIDCDAEVIDCDADSMSSDSEEDRMHGQFRIGEAIKDMWDIGLKIALESASFNGARPYDLELETIYNNLDSFEKVSLDRLYYAYLMEVITIRPLSAMPQQELQFQIWELYHQYIYEFFYGKRSLRN